MDKQLGPTLKRVSYAPSKDIVTLSLASDRIVQIPRRSIKELRGLSERQMRALHPDNAGATLSQRELDIDIYLPGLLANVFGIKPAAMLGKAGGSKTSPAKRRASQANGRLGGRPRKKKRARARANKQLIGVVVKPGSKRPGISKEGETIVLRVREHAIEGAANDACIRALAKHYGVPPPKVNLVQGARSRHKRFSIED